MADLKISQLTGATTPLSGTELVPVVQGGVTKKVSVDNLTQGKVVYAATFAAATSSIIGQGGTSTGLGALYLNGGSGGGGGLIQGQQNSSPTWLIGDTATALGSGTGMIEFIYGGAPKITWLQGIGEVHRSVQNGIQFPAGKGLDFGSSVLWRTGAGSPEGVVTASVGSLYTNTSGGANTTLYVKESGTGNTGWVAK